MSDAPRISIPPVLQCDDWPALDAVSSGSGCGKSLAKRGRRRGPPRRPLPLSPREDSAGVSRHSGSLTAASSQSSTIVRSAGCGSVGGAIGRTRSSSAPKRRLVSVENDDRQRLPDVHQQRRLVKPQNDASRRKSSLSTDPNATDADTMSVQAAAGCELGADGSSASAKRRLLPADAGARGSPCDRRPSIQQAEYAELGEQLMATLRQVTPSSHDMRRRVVVLRRIASRIHEFWDDAEVVVVGSFATGLILNDSDLDVVVRCPGRTIEFGEICALVDHLQPLSFGIKAIPAEVPLIKMRDRVDGVEVDIAFNATTGVQTTTLIDEYCDQYASLRPLVLLLKFFLRQHGLNDLYSGGLSSYMLTLMAISFFQFHPEFNMPHDVCQALASDALADDDYDEMDDLYDEMVAAATEEEISEDDEEEDEDESDRNGSSLSSSLTASSSEDEEDDELASSSNCSVGTSSGCCSSVASPTYSSSYSLGEEQLALQALPSAAAAAPTTSSVSLADDAEALCALVEEASVNNGPTSSVIVLQTPQGLVPLSPDGALLPSPSMDDMFLVEPVDGCCLERLVVRPIDRFCSCVDMAGPLGICKMLLKFLEYYTYEFAYDSTGISILNGGGLFPKDSRWPSCPSTVSVGASLALENPINPLENLGRKAHSFERVVQALTSVRSSLLVAASSQRNTRQHHHHHRRKSHHNNNNHNNNKSNHHRRRSSRHHATNSYYHQQQQQQQQYNSGNGPLLGSTGYPRWAAGPSVRRHHTGGQ